MRSGLRWPGIIALAAAFGIIQAGVVDQSLFSESYRDIDYWARMLQPTLIKSFGFGAYNAMNFIMGHVIWSYCVPIALVESLCPALSDQPWLRRSGFITTALLYLGAAALILADHLRNEKDHASVSQIAGSLVVVALLTAFAFTIGRLRRPARDTAVPKPIAVGVLSLIAALAFGFMPTTWWGVAGGLTVLVISAGFIAHFARSVRWGGQHVVALASGALLARAMEAFFAVPLGDVPAIAKYTHNIVFLLGALLLSVWAFWRNRLSRDPAC